MYRLNCTNCKKELSVEEIKAGATVICECGYAQECVEIEKNNNLTLWRVIEPSELKEKGN